MQGRADIPAFIRNFTGDDRYSCWVAPPAKPNITPLVSTKDAAFVQPLSERERDVLRLLGSELTGPGIARELVVSLSTVRTHTRSIYARLGVSSRRAAIRRAEELNLLRTPRL